MTFDELWKIVCVTSTLPEGAQVHLPKSLSERTKKRVVKLSAEELSEIVADVISTINAGSVESIDDLVMKGLKKRQV